MSEKKMLHRYITLEYTFEVTDRKFKTAQQLYTVVGILKTDIQFIVSFVRKQENKHYKRNRNKIKTSIWYKSRKVCKEEQTVEYPGHLIANFPTFQSNMKFVLQYSGDIQKTSLYCIKNRVQQTIYKYANKKHSGQLRQRRGKKCSSFVVIWADMCRRFNRYLR